VSLIDVVFSYGPYLTLFAFAGAWMYRWGILKNQGAAPVEPVGPEAEGALALGFVVLATGHLTTLAAPEAMRALIADPERVAVIEAIGLIGALLFAFGVGARLRRRVQALRAGRPRQGPGVVLLALLLMVCLSGLALTVWMRWLTVWYAYIFVPYLRSLFETEPVTGAIVASPWLVQLHTLLFMALVALWPMSGLPLEEIFPLRGVARRFGEGASASEGAPPATPASETRS